MPSAPVPRACTSKPSNSSASVRPRTMSGSSSITRMRFFPGSTTGSFISLSGQPQPERRSLVRLAVDGDVAAVRARDVAHEREPDAAAADRQQAHRARAIEALEDVLLLV